MRAAEEPFPGDPRCGQGHSGEDHPNFGHQVSAVPAERDAVHPGEGLPGRSRNSIQVCSFQGNSCDRWPTAPCCPCPGPRADLYGLPAIVSPQTSTEKRGPGLVHEHAHQRKNISLLCCLVMDKLLLARPFSVHGPDFQQRAVWSRGRGEGSERNRVQADGGSAQQEHGLLRAAGPVLQQGKHHQPHSAT